MATCVKCGAFVADNARICPKCGAQIISSSGGTPVVSASLIAGLPPPPASNIPGVFPREHLSSSEILVYETKPNILPFILSPLVGFAVLQVFGLLIYYADPSGYSFETCMILEMALVFFFIIGLVSGIIDWMGRKYALSSDKIYGARGIISRNIYQCTPDKIQNITLEQGVFQRLLGYGSIVFWTAGMGGGTSGVGFEYRAIGGGGVVWSKVNDPVALKRYAEEVVNVFQKRKKLEEYHDMAAAFAQTQQASPIRGAAPPPGPTAMFCPACGTPAQAGMAFCAKCGKRIKA